MKSSWTALADAFSATGQKRLHTWCTGAEGFRLYAGAPTKKKVPYQRTLTAANYRYFTRGGNEKAAPGDVQVQLPGQKKLAAYDQMLRRFE